MDHRESRITIRSLLVGLFFAATFAWLTVYFADRHAVYITATQLPVLPYVLLFLMVLLLNPVCRLVRVVRRFSRAEVLIIFMMGMVSSGVSTFGLTAQLIPVIGSLFNPSWNHEQSEWNRHVVPLLDDRYFLAVEGISEASGDYAEKVTRQRDLQIVIDAANRYLVMEERVNQAKAALADHLATADLVDDQQAQLIEARLRGELQAARQVASQAEQQWAKVGEKFPGLAAAEQALPDYRQRLEEVEKEVSESRQILRELEQEAFAKVELFRRGLPTEQRAVPGFVMQSEDTRSSYLARLRRTVAGHRATRHLPDAVGQLRDGQTSLAVDSLAAAREQLAVMDDLLGLEHELTVTRIREQEMTDDLLAIDQHLRDLNISLRVAEREDIRHLERAIARGRQRAIRARRNRDRLREQRRYLQQQASIALAVQPLLEQVTSVQRGLEQGTGSAADAEILLAVVATLPELDGCWQRFTVGDVPWSQWWGPLWRWGLLAGLSYIVLMTFNVLIFRQWAHHEKLVYPLAQLPETLAGEESGGGRLIPLVFRNPGFWLGFAIAGSFMGYNVLAHSNLLPGLTPLNFENSWNAYIRETAFDGLLLGKFQRSHIFFTMIGLAFLIPSKVSFSLWFFAVLSMVQLLFLVWLGYGTNEASFPNEWWYTLNFRTAEGAGALIVFSSVVLFKCRYYLFCAFSANRVSNLETDERRELRYSSVLFIIASLGVILLVWRSMGASLPYTLFSYLFILIITIGLVRAVAEGGLLGFQAWVNPFHLIRSFFGMDKAWTSAPLFAPILVYYSILFLDIKTFIAPAMANSIKIRDDLRMRRGLFHLAIFSAIAVSAAVAIVVSIIFAYSDGADVMSSWFYTGFPQSLFERISMMQQDPPLSTPAETLWLIVGAGLMAGLLYFRQWLFWLPHPIGMIMLVNPLMGAYWFSLMLGWLAKSLVTKYGNKDTYKHARLIFIGLIVGELTMVALATAITVYTGTRIPIDLNRN